MNAARTQAKYAEYMRNKVRELLTRFGKVDVLWFDFSYPPGAEFAADDFAQGKGRMAWESEKLHALVRELMPSVIIDDRLDLPGVGDFKTPEQWQPREWITHEGQRVVWEACQTLSGSWGYHRDEMTWRASSELIRTLVDCVSKGGNLLLNVGPTGRGELDERALDRLADIGEWMKRHQRSIYGCTQAPDEFKAPEHCRLTYNPQTKRLYIHIFAWPPYGFLYVDGLADKAEYIQFLHDASEVTYNPLPEWQGGAHISKNTLTLRLPTMPKVAVPVIEVFLK